MNLTYYGFYGKDILGIYTNAHNMMKLMPGVPSFRYKAFPDLQSAISYIMSGYNSTKFISGRIENLDGLSLNKAYSSAEARFMGWTSAGIYGRR